MSKRTRLVLGLLLLFAGVIGLLGRETFRGASGISKPQTARAASEMDEHHVVQAESENQNLAEPPVEPSAGEPVAASRGSPTAGERSAGMVTVVGTVVVDDIWGGEHAQENGTIVYHEEGKPRVLRIDTIVHGWWSTTLPEQSQIVIKDIALGQNPTECSDVGKGLAIPDDHKLVLHARWPNGTILHVRAEDTGQDLSQVEVVGAIGGDWEGSKDPGEYGSDRVLAASVNSPVRIEALPELVVHGGDQNRSGGTNRVFYLRSPGYAWNRTDLHFKDGGESEVILKPAGTLEVSITGTLPTGQDLVLRVRTPGSWADVLRPIRETGTIRLQSIAAGHTQISLVANGLSENSSTIGSAEAEVTPGGIAEAKIVLP